jgi:hypothetical protein
MKMKITQFNSSNAESRLSFLNSLKERFQEFQKDFLHSNLSSHLPQLMNYLIDVMKKAFIPSSSSSASSAMVVAMDIEGKEEKVAGNGISLDIALRLCLEAVKLFKKLTSEAVYEERLTDSVEKLESYLLALQQDYSKHYDPSLKKATMRSSMSSQIPSHSTIILYYSHLYHDTPEDHIENEKRVQTCLKRLMKLKDTLPSVSSLSSANSSSATGEPEENPYRSLLFENCNSIKAPPLWCLPLVHSSQYLKRLWDYEEEAKRDDLFVPLEFDTEWESEYGYESDSTTSSSTSSLINGRTHSQRNEEKEKQQQFLRSYFNFLPSYQWKQTLGDEKLSKVISLLKPKKDDYKIASSLIKKNSSYYHSLRYNHPNNSSFLRTRRSHIVRGGGGVGGADSLFLQDDNNNGNQFSSRKGRPPLIKRVKTIYGNGVLIKDMSSLSDGINIIRLDWGATAYMNSGSFSHLSSSSTSASGSSSLGRTPSTSGSSAVGVLDPAAELFQQQQQRDQSRFLHTDLRLHKLLTRILAQLKVQRHILDRVDVKDAHMSLWLHGRTSIGISKSIESAIYSWLVHYDREKVEAILLEREKQGITGTGTMNGLLGGGAVPDFLQELQRIYSVKQVVSRYEDYFGMDTLYDKGQLRAEAFDYSSKRLINKSGLPRANGPRNRTKKGQKVGEDGNSPRTPMMNRGLTSPATSSSSFTSSSVVGTSSRMILPPPPPLISASYGVGGGDGGAEEGSGIAGATLYKPKRQRKRKELAQGYFTSEEEIKVIEYDLQALLVSLMRLLNYSQTDLADNLWKRFGTKTTQTGISAWYHQRAGNELSTRLTMQSFLFLYSYKHLFVGVFLKELSKLNEIAELKYFQHLLVNHSNSLSSSSSSSSSSGVIGPPSIIPPVKKENNGSSASASASVPFQHRLLSSVNNNSVTVKNEGEQDRPSSPAESLMSEDDVDSNSINLPAKRNNKVTMKAEQHGEPSLLSFHHEPSKETESSLREDEDQMSIASEPSNRKIPSEKEDSDTESSDNSTIELIKEPVVVKGKRKAEALSTKKKQLQKKKPQEEREEESDDGEEKEEGQDEKKAGSDSESDEEDEENDDQPIIKRGRGKPITKKSFPKINISERSYVQEMKKKEELSDGSFSILINDFKDEIDRRALTHIYIGREALRLGLPLLSQPTVSKFIRTRTNPFNSKAIDFTYQIVR